MCPRCAPLNILEQTKRAAHIFLQSLLSVHLFLIGLFVMQFYSHLVTQATGHRFEPWSRRGYSDILWISLIDWITDPERVRSTDQLRLNLGNTRKHTHTHSDILWISLIDWIPDPERFSSTDQKRLNIISHWGESMESGITKLGVRNGFQLLMRAID